MHDNNQKIRVPGSFRTQPLASSASSGAPGALRKTGIALGISSTMLVPGVALAQEVEMAPVTVVERAYATILIPKRMRRTRRAFPVMSAGPGHWLKHRPRSAS